jgi:hypothetical protein
VQLLDNIRPTETCERPHEAEGDQRTGHRLRTEVIKVKFTSHRGTEGEKRHSCTLSLTSALDWGRWVMPRRGRFPSGNDPVSIVKDAEWGPGEVWTGAENLAATGIRSPDRPARSKLLYRLSCPGPHTVGVLYINLIMFGFDFV